MKRDDSKTGELKETVVRICPACGVVNPSGPSQACPHIQLARFDGLNDSLAELLDQVARARCVFDELAGKLKQELKEALRNHEAQIETRKEAAKSGLDRPERQPRKAPALNLENPEPPPAKTSPTKRKTRKTALPPPIDPRQLELISREPPKGEA